MGGLAAGLEHSVALTEEGGVFSWGSSKCGQLGHGNLGKETRPRKVMELMGTLVTAVAAGDRHTLAYVPSRNKLYAFGVGGSGQLGRGAELTQNAAVPQIVAAAGGEVARIGAGGNTSWCTVAPHPALDQRTAPPAIALLSLPLLRQLAATPEEEMLDQDLLEGLEVAFSSLACINGSLLAAGHHCCKASNPGTDLAMWREAHAAVAASPHDSLASLVFTGLLQAMGQLKEAPPDTEALRFYLTFPLHPAFADPGNLRELHFPFAEKCLGLKGAAWKVMERWIAGAGAPWLKQVVAGYKAAALPVLQMAAPSQEEVQALQVLLLFLRVLSRINSEHGYPVSYETFYLPEVREAHNLAESYVRWLVDVQAGKDVSAGFYICNYPFMFDPPAKEAILRTDQAYSQQQAQQNSIIQMVFSGQAQVPYLMLMVTRENIVQDTIIQLQSSNTADLKKPLRVKFSGEEAEDAGGVTKEFFLLLIKEILNPDYGMFREFEESSAMWFNPMTYEDNSYYFLIGILYGLAIYNFTIINVPFPLVLYDKLLKEEVPEFQLSDLAQLTPTVARSLQHLLDYAEPDTEEVFSLTFTITEEQFGEAAERPLKAGGEQLAVTTDNKAEYVRLYTDYVLNKSCETQFAAFKQGFLKVVSKRVLELFHPQELMATVVGNENYDWEVMEELCTYKEGYSREHPTILHFWQVFHAFPPEEKKKFLLFLTGSDRIPIVGMTSVKVCIQRTADTSFLPVAHTCFNLLDLPEYQTRERLQFKLLQAIQCTQGFGIV